MSNEVLQKCCTGPCGRWLPATSEFFHREKRAKDGLHSRCKMCVRAYNEVYHNRLEVQERIQAYRSHPEVQKQRRIYEKAYRSRPEIRARNRAYLRTYRQADAHKEEREKYLRRAEIRERMRVHKNIYQSQPEIRERIRIYKKAYRRRPEVRELTRINKVNYYSRKRAVQGTHTAQQIRDLLISQHHHCYYCGGKFARVNGKYIYHVDHTFPLSRVAGTDIPANNIDYLVLACPLCNDRKGDKYPWEFPEGGRLL